MPSAPVPNPPWLTGTWADTAWEEGTWGIIAPAVVPDQTIAVAVRARSASLALDVAVSGASGISGQALAAPPSLALGLRARPVSGGEDVGVLSPAIARSVKVS